MAKQEERNDIGEKAVHDERHAAGQHGSMMPLVTISSCTGAPARLKLPPEGLAANARNKVRMTERVNGINRLVKKRGLCDGATPKGGVGPTNHKTIPLVLKFINHAKDIRTKLGLNIVRVTHKSHVFGKVIVDIHEHNSKVLLREHRLDASRVFSRVTPT